MAKPARGLPSSFSLDLPDEGPVIIGDFLDEAPPVIVPRKKPQNVAGESAMAPTTAERPFKPQIVPERQVEERPQPRPVQKAASGPNVIRYQLNLTPKAKIMLEELVEHVRTYSPENDARVSEVFQGIIGLLHSAMGELDLAELPRRGAWGSVTAKNFPGALSEAFERAIVSAANK